MATSIDGIVLRTNGTSVATAALETTSSARDTQAAAAQPAASVAPGEAFTQHVQQALNSLDLAPATQTSAAELSTVLYDLFKAIDAEGTPVRAAASGDGASPAGLSLASSPWKPVDMVSGLHQMIDELQSATSAGAADATTAVGPASDHTAAAPAALRPQLAQLQSDFAGLVEGTSASSPQFTSTLIAFLKALQENLPAWPPSLAARGGNVNATA